jgi:hypothetical protein
MRTHINITNTVNLRHRQGPSRLTFREMIDMERIPAAKIAWDRARLASRLRRKAAIQGRWKSARRLAAVKLKAIKLAFRLAPECMTINIDGEYQIGLPSISWSGRGRLHFPVDNVQELPTGSYESETRTDRQAS